MALYNLDAQANRVVQVDSTGVAVPAGTSGSPLSSAVTTVPTTGAQANAWNAAAVAAAGVSAAVDLQYTSQVTIMGQASAATTITVQFSQDGTNWRNGQTIAAGAATDFVVHISGVGARYIRLASSAAATITSTVAGKN